MTTDRRDAQIKELQAQVTMLTDLVVSAAALHFGQIGDASEQDYLSEALHIHATELVAANPRLSGTFRPDSGFESPSQEPR